MSRSEEPSVDPGLLEVLRCPVTGARLDLRQVDGETVLVSTDEANPLIYPVRDGVPVLLAEEGRPAR
ncbi:Trm112 family protein [Pseudactinotalea sp. Z1732]|uniref:Trm112 family protein n=1 Tax=Micrococcales TaxID=85006 RepID=UPI003C7A5FF5